MLARPTDAGARPGNGVGPSSKKAMLHRRPFMLAAASTAALAMAALATLRWRGGEPTVRVIQDPAGQRATMLLNAADTALAHGSPSVARAALASAFDQPTQSPEIAYRVARLADRLDEPGTAAGAYRRVLAVAPAGAVADSARVRLLALDGGRVARLEAAGETERTVARRTAMRRHIARR